MTFFVKSSSTDPKVFFIDYRNGTPYLLYRSGVVPPVTSGTCPGNILWVNPTTGCIQLPLSDFNYGTLNPAIIDDGKLPTPYSGISTTNASGLYLSKNISIRFDMGREGITIPDGTGTAYYPNIWEGLTLHMSGNSTSWVCVAVDVVSPTGSTTPTGYVPYNYSGSFVGGGVTMSVTSTDVYTNNSSTASYLNLIGPGDTDVRIDIKTRWRELYDDYTVVSPVYTLPFYNDTSSQYVTSAIGVTSGTYANYTSSVGGYYPAGTITVTFENTCRSTDPCVSISPPPECRNIVHLSSLNSYQLPADSGRPIDIDILNNCGNVISYPTDSDFSSYNPTSYVLYFNPRALKAVPVINDVVYNTTALNITTDIVPLYSGSSVGEIRNWTCANLKYATVTNLNTVISGSTPEAKVSGLNYNWPFNDLYWNERCDTTPSGEIPINLVPC